MSCHTGLARSLRNAASPPPQRPAAPLVDGCGRNYSRPQKKPRRSGAKFLAGCRNASNGNPPTPYHIGCTAFGRLAPVDKMMPRGSHSNPGSRRAVGAAPPPATAAPRHSTTSELACVSVDASLRHCCAAVPHINANLRNISRCCHSVACSAASMLSLVNQSKRITRSIADLPSRLLRCHPQVFSVLGSSPGSCTRCNHGVTVR